LRQGSADLHVHTSFSDGLHRPADVVEMAKSAGLTWIGITDHDAVGGIGEALEAAERLGVGCVPGVELSVDYRGQDFHILGYWIDPENGALRELLGEILESRSRRADRIISRLHAMGVRITLEEIRKQMTGPRYIGRPHIAQALMARGDVQTFPEAFVRYIGRDAPAYVPKEPLEPSEALAVIRGAGGVPVMAHPGAYRMDGAFRVFLSEGLAGLETDHPKHSVEQQASFRRLAQQHDLVMTGGSDFHGRGVSDAVVGGVTVDARVLDELAARKDSKR